MSRQRRHWSTLDTERLQQQREATMSGNAGGYEKPLGGVMRRPAPTIPGDPYYPKSAKHKRRAWRDIGKNKKKRRKVVENEDLQSAMVELEYALDAYKKAPSTGTRYALGMAKAEVDLLER